jgi:hypothetical protein
MKPPIFLSASMPDRNLERYVPEPECIREAVHALVAAVVRERELVFGGHPAISPLVEHAAHDLGGVEHVHIFQSRFFERAIPPEAKRFPNLHWTQAVSGPTEEESRRASLTLMRTEMIEFRPYAAGVFIGGMDGIEEEWDLFARLRPDTPRFPVASTGGAAQTLWQRYGPGAYPLWDDLKSELRYHTLFRKLLRSD